MSIPILVLRIEAKDTSQIPQDFYYLGAGRTQNKASYAKVVGGGSHADVSISESLDIHRGRRTFTNIIIETFVFEDTMAEGGGDEVTTLSAAMKHTKVRGSVDNEDDTKQFSPIKEEVNTSEGACSDVRLPEEDVDSRPGSGKRAHSHSPHSTLPTTIRFFSGNPAVETSEGIIHIYKENQFLVDEESTQSEMVIMLGVPSTMSSQDILQFIAPVASWIEHMKIVKEGKPNQYMVIFKFKSKKNTTDFFKNFNNKAFNSLEPETCHLFFVSKIEALTKSEGACLPVSGLTELPVCPVCLERMDESVSGILTVLCNHSFHGACLAQWLDSICPVCRYTQTPEAVADNKCFQCNSTESLWICLICGHVGCGRYVEGHAFSHFQETSHTYSMQLGNNRVWDYAGDNYVHRLVQSKGDGKMVQVDEGGREMSDEKVDSLSLEYTYLLTSQLDSQRRYFEEKLTYVELEALRQREEIDMKMKLNAQQFKELENKFKSTADEKQHCEKKCNQMSSKMKKILHELMEEKEINKSLQQNQDQWKVKVQQLEQSILGKEKEMSEMQEQLRDVMFYLEAQQKLASASGVSKEEIQEGQIVVGENSPGAGGKKHRKKGR